MTYQFIHLFAGKSNSDMAFLYQVFHQKLVIDLASLIEPFILKRVLTSKNVRKLEVFCIHYFV